MRVPVNCRTEKPVVNIEAVFGETVNTGVEYRVFLTPNGDCKGLYVAQKSPTSFVVRELGGGHSSIAFDYRIMAKRVGYEKVRLTDLTEQLNKQEAQSPKMRRPVRPSAEPKASLKMPTPPVLPIRAAGTTTGCSTLVSAVGGRRLHSQPMGPRLRAMAPSVSRFQAKTRFFAFRSDDVL